MKTMRTSDKGIVALVGVDKNAIVKVWPVSREHEAFDWRDKSDRYAVYALYDSDVHSNAHLNGRWFG